MSFKASWDEFAQAAYHQLNGNAEAKGYAAQGGDGRKLLDFVAESCGEGHALGEIIYKVTRWRRKRNPEDLLKVAAWAFLEWDRHERGKAVK